MKDMGIVYGDQEAASPLIVGKTTVYVHTDIEELENGGYQYHEIQYGKDEYIQLMAEQHSKLEDTVVELAQVALGEQVETPELSNLFARKVDQGKLESVEILSQIQSREPEISQAEPDIKKKG